MAPALREILRYVAIGASFGLIWAVMQYANGQIRDFASLAGPVMVFALAGILTWFLRKTYKAIFKR